VTTHMLRKTALLALLFASTSHHALAGLAVSPLTHEAEVAPGKTAKFFLTVPYNARNKFALPEPVSLSIHDIAIERDGTICFQPPGKSKRSAAAWLTVDDTDFTVKPGSAHRVKCVVRVPYGHTGERTAVILTKVGRPTIGKTAQVLIQHQVATLVRVNIKGRTFPKKAEVHDVQVIVPPATPDAKTPRQPVQIAATMRNKGEVSFVATGEARLRATDGNHRAYPLLELKAKTRTIFPGCRRDFVAIVPFDLPAGTYRADVAFGYGSKWRKARGNATLTLEQPRQAPDVLPGSSSLRITPNPIAVTMAQGTTSTVPIAVRNLSNRQMLLRSTVHAHTPGAESWLRLPSAVILRGDAERTLRLRVQAPGQLEAPHKFALTFETSCGGKTVVPVSVLPQEPLHAPRSQP